MQLRDILNVLTFTSFRPEPEDYSASWSSRFPNQRTLMLNVNRNSVRWQVMLKGGQIGDGGIEEGEFNEVVQTMADEWKSMIDEGWCSVSINNRFILSLENNLSRKKGYTELLRVNPKSVLGGKFERGKSYALHHHPVTNSSLLLASEELLLKDLQESLRRSGLKTGRISCGLFAIVSDVLTRLHSTTENSAEEGESSGAPSNYLLIACCEGSVCILKQKDQQWTELRSRSAFFPPGDLSSLSQILQPMLNDWDASSPVIFVSDSKEATNLEQLNAILPGLPIDDVTDENQLWNIIGKN